MDERADPRAAYTRRLAERRAAAFRAARADRWISHARLAAIVGAAVAAWLSWGRGSMSPWWLAPPAAGFLALVFVHGRVITTRGRSDRAAAFYDQGLARLDHRWAGRGDAGERFLDHAHVYGADLDLFGRGSLFELLCTARTQAGEETLAAWLLAPASPGDVRARQDAVRELRARVDLREDLALLGTDVRAGVHAGALAAWGTAAPVLRSRWIPIAAGLLAAAGVVSLSLWWAGVVSLVPFVVCLAADLTFALPLRARVLQVVGAVGAASHELAVLSHILSLLEREAFSSSRLIQLRAMLASEGVTPSRRIAALRRLIDLLDARRNQLFMPVACLLLWGTQFAFAAESWRAAAGPAVPRWLAVVGEFEALAALAGYAWEHPEDPFPDILEAAGGPCFDAEALGHPLIPSETCVRNDVRLGRAHPRALVVSGSNMSGKSTLLRTVGVNTVLALAGAPVRASRLRLTPLAVGATLRIQDSLQTGTSRFYAEISRLRAIVDLTQGSTPLLFLLDEMLNGTNSQDRRVGAEAVLGWLVDHGAIGLVTTHDLALSQIADALAPRAANVHFEDHLEDGRMTFDYLCRPGIMTRSNALALMRAVGLDVGASTGPGCVGGQRA
jgi:hypothetical protein